MEQYFEMVRNGFVLGFALSLAGGFTSWSISAVCRVVISLVREGVR